MSLDSVDAVCAILRRRGEPMTFAELLHACELDKSSNSTSPQTAAALRETVALGKTRFATVRLADADAAVAWRLGTLQIESDALVAFLSAPPPSMSSSSQSQSLSSLQTPISAAKKRAAPPTALHSAQKCFKSPFKPVATPKRANVVAAAAVVAADPLVAAAERFVAAQARLTALKASLAAGATPSKIATRTAQTRPLDNDDRLEQLTASWRTACAAAFDELLPKQRDSVSGKLLTRAQLGKALQVEPWHVGLTEWSDDEEDEPPQPEADVD